MRRTNRKGKPGRPYLEYIILRAIHCGGDDDSICIIICAMPVWPASSAGRCGNDSA